MTDNKIELDEARRAANYEAIKTNVKSEVGGEIVHEANARVDHRGDIENVAGRMRQNAVHEVIQTENEVQRGRVVARISSAFAGDTARSKAGTSARCCQDCSSGLTITVPDWLSRP